MRKAGAAEAKIPARHGVLSAATYSLELAIITASYLGLAAMWLSAPSINLAATPLWPPSGLALALVLVRGFRIWPAILVGLFSCQIMGGRSVLESASIGIGSLLAGTRRGVDDWSLVERSQDVRNSCWHRKVCPHFLCPDRDDQFNRRPGSLHCRGQCWFRGFCRHLGNLVAGRCGRHLDHCSRHRALGDDAPTSFLHMGFVGNSRGLHSLDRHRRHCLQSPHRQRPH